jgi:hypothetical protein
MPRNSHAGRIRPDERDTDDAVTTLGASLPVRKTNKNKRKPGKANVKRRHRSKSIHLSSERWPDMKTNKNKRKPGKSNISKARVVIFLILILISAFASHATVMVQFIF